MKYDKNEAEVRTGAATHPPGSARHPDPAGWRDVVIFVALAFGLGWLVCLPLWVGKANSGASFYWGLPPNTVLMFAPTAATFIVVFWVRRPASIPRFTWLWPLRPFGRTAGYCLTALVLPPLLGLFATLIAAAFGVVELDPENFSMLRQRLSETLPGFAIEGTGFPTAAFLSGLLLLLAAGFLPTLVLTFGEEWGWRGYLLPRLLPLGVWPALLLSGLIWGLWHAPILLVGVDGLRDLLLPLMFVVSTMLMGIIFGWLRLASGSVWPAVIVHAANNSMNVLGFWILADASAESAPVIYAAGLGGVIGWVVLAAFVVFLSAASQITAKVSQAGK